jgi:hypothetical protein
MIYRRRLWQPVARSSVLFFWMFSPVFLLSIVLSLVSVDAF